MLCEQVICNQDVLDDIITCSGTQFTSRFWKRVCSHMSINHRLSTAFHPQTDGQKEHQNRTTELYLPAFCNSERNHWFELKGLVELAYNNSVHASTRMTLFWAVYHRHPKMQFKTAKATSHQSETEADVLLEVL
jgi:hypothetical protein